MTTHMPFRVCPVLFLVAVLSGSAPAQWSPDPTVNTPIVTSSGDQRAPRLVGDGVGGYLISWLASDGPYLQRLSSGGARMWATGGVKLTGVSEVYDIIPDRSGGGWICWATPVSALAESVIVMKRRILSSGVLQPVTLRSAAATGASESYAVTKDNILHDGDGGIILVVGFHVTDYPDWYHDELWRINSLGQRTIGASSSWAGSWSSISHPVGRANHGTNFFVFNEGRRDENDAAWLCRYPNSGGGWHVLLDGINAWQEYTFAVDNVANSIAVWKPGYPGSAGNLYATKVSSTGQKLWNSNTLVAPSTAGSPRSACATVDGLGGATIAWIDNRVGTNTDVRAQRLNSSGVPQWLTNGIPICTQSSNQSSPVIVGDGENGAIIAWVDRRNGNDDVFAQRVDQLGNALWQSNGIPVSTAPGAQSSPPLIPGGVNVAIAAWEDLRNGNIDIYGTKVIPTNLVLNPGFEGGEARWYFWTNGVGSFTTVSPGAVGTKAGKVTVTTLGSSIQLKQLNIPLVAGAQYRLTFKAKSSTGRDMLAGVQKNPAPWTTYGLMGHRVNLGTTWGTYSVRFNVDGFTGTVTDGTLLFLFGADAANGESYYIDEVVLERVVPPVAGVPKVTTQPVGKTVSVGQTLVFTVTATGTPPLSYQWQKKGPLGGHVGEVRDIPGATSPSYTALATALADDGTEYRCQVRNALGVASTNQAYLTVNHLRNGGFELGTTSWTLIKSASAGAAFTTVTPGAVGTRAARVSMTALPPGSAVYLKQLGFPLLAGGQYRLTFKAKSSTGRDMTMGVQKDVSPYTCYGLMDHRVNLTTAWGTYSVLFNTNGFSGTAADGRFLFSFGADAAAGESYYIDEVVLEKLTTPVPGVPKVTTQPVSRTVVRGQRATFSVVATGTGPLYYQWQKNGKDIALATAATHTTPPTTSADNGAEYRCQVRNTLGVASSNHAKLTVTGLLAKEGGGDEPSNQTLPKEYGLLQNYPNPLNPVTTIEYALPEQAHVVIKIYNTLGQEVAELVDETQEAGYRSVTWDATNSPSGAYFYWMRAGSFMSLKKLLVIK